MPAVCAKSDLSVARLHEDRPPCPLTSQQSPSAALGAASARSCPKLCAKGTRGKNLAQSSITASFSHQSYHLLTTLRLLDCYVLLENSRVSQLSQVPGCVQVCSQSSLGQGVSGATSQTLSIVSQQDMKPERSSASRRSWLMAFIRSSIPRHEEPGGEETQLLMSSGSQRGLSLASRSACSGRSTRCTVKVVQWSVLSISSTECGVGCGVIDQASHDRSKERRRAMQCRKLLGSD